MIHRKIKGYVYFIQLGHLKYFKIGFSQSLTSRLASLDSSLPLHVKLIAYAKVIDANRVEQALHKKYIDNRTNGEWFFLNHSYVQWIKISLEKLHDPSVIINMYESESGF